MQNSLDYSAADEDQELNLLKLNLSLTTEERLKKHQKALNLVNELKKVKRDGERSQLSTEDSPRSRD
jgi:hypothetical protein